MKYLLQCIYEFNLNSSSACPINFLINIHVIHRLQSPVRNDMKVKLNTNLITGKRVTNTLNRFTFLCKCLHV